MHISLSKPISILVVTSVSRYDTCGFCTSLCNLQSPLVHLLFNADVDITVKKKAVNPLLSEANSHGYPVLHKISFREINDTVPG